MSAVCGVCGEVPGPLHTLKEKSFPSRERREPLRTNSKPHIRDAPPASFTPWVHAGLMRNIDAG